MRRVGRLRVGLTAIGLLAPVPLASQELRYEREYPAVRYSSRTPSSRVERLRQAMARGAVHLQHEPGRGRLRALLRELEVPVESQVLVYSRTSLQEGLIAPETPRAIYFADDVYVAWVQGGDVLEIGAMDATLGPVFYTLSQDAGERPPFERQNELCLECHDTYGLTGGGVPRFLIGSGLTDARGRVAVHGGWHLTTPATPLEERWGGWYVTGTHGQRRHLGNVIVEGPAEAEALDLAASGNLTDLSRLIDTSPYLAAHSDIAALLVLEHQIHVQNLLTRLSWETRAPGVEGDRLAELAEPVVRALLFADEVPLEAPVSGTSGFREAFERAGPHDAAGRSLRQLGLRRKVFRWPLSPQVYSEALTALPPAVESHVYRRLWEVLSGADRGSGFERVSGADGRAALEILEATHPGFARWLEGR